MIELPIVDGRYETAPKSISRFAKAFPGLSFYSRLTVIVLTSAWRAWRGTYDGVAWTQSSLQVMRALESVGVEFDITGIDHLRDIDGPCLVVGNHMSTLETMILPGIIQPIREVTFVVKQALITYPIFKHVMRSRDPVAVSQVDARADLKLMLSGGLERLGNGISLVVFPQGERTPTFQPKQFNSIGVKLAGRSGVPIVPVALRTDAWGLGSIISDFGRIDPTKKVYFAFGTPLQVAGRGAKENETLIRFIEGRLQQWQVDKTDC